MTTTEPTQALSPCRRCGGEGNINHYFGIAINGWTVECCWDMEFGDGSHGTARYSSESEAITAWNTRAHQPQPVDVDLRERVARAMFLGGYKGQSVLAEAEYNPHCADALARADAAIAAMQGAGGEHVRLEYKMACGNVAQGYIRELWGDYWNERNMNTLPATFRWHECFDRMVTAAMPTKSGEEAS